MKITIKCSLLAVAALLVLSLAVCGGLTMPVQAASVNVTVLSSTPWGVSTCYIGATEGNNDFNVAQMLDLGINTYRIWGGTSRWEYEDDDGVYGSPTIAEIKADPNVINWDWWDTVMTTPPYGTDYHWTDLPPNSWEGNARTIFQTLKENGIKPVVTLRNVDNADNPAWAQQMNPPDTPEDWNEWWEHVFATVYWFNVRNDYQIDNWQVHNEPNNASQGWGGTIEDYNLFVQYTYDAVKYVYDNYLPGRQFYLHAPVSNGSWPRDVLQAVGQYYNVEDIHNYYNDMQTYTQKVHGWMNDAGYPDRELWNSEWGSWHANQYDTVGNATKLLINNLILMSQPDLDYIYGNHVFALYDWSDWGSGLIHGYEENPTYTPGYYGMRLAIRALQGCKTTYQTSSSNSKNLAITTQNASGNIYLLVTNIAAQPATVNADLSALITSGTGTQWEFGDAHMDEIVGNPTLSGGQVTFTVPKYGAVALEFSGGPPPTDTPVPPTNTPEPPTATPTEGPSLTPTDTPEPTDTPVPTSTPGGSTEMHVQDIYTTDENGTPKDSFTKGEYVYWRAQILDQDSSPVSDADVTCEIIRPDSSQWTSKTKTTGADGWALFSLKTNPSNKTGTYTINITDVVKTGATYNPAANVKDSHQFYLQ